MVEAIVKHHYADLLWTITQLEAERDLLQQKLREALDAYDKTARENGDK